MLPRIRNPHNDLSANPWDHKICQKLSSLPQGPPKNPRQKNTASATKERMKKWPKSYPCHARRDSENGNGALVKQTFASEQIRVPNHIPQGELSQCLLLLCLPWNHTGGRGELFQASEMSAILIVLRPTASVLTDFAVLASIFDWRSALKKKEQRNSPSTF